MGRPLRFFEPDGIYFISGRCLQARLLLRPSDETNRIIMGVLARAISRFRVDVFAFVFTSNHFHMLVRSQDLRIPAFMQFLRGNIAKKLGALVHWTGKFWDRRYDAEPVLDDDALVGRLRYILAHGVKEHLVRRCGDWPGPSALPELMHGEQRNFAWPGSGTSPEQPLRLATLPCWENLSTHEQCAQVRDLCADIDAEHTAGNVLGVDAILRQHPHTLPKTVAKRKRPRCHASTASAAHDYESRYTAFADEYRVAKERWAPHLKGVFPLYAYGPPWTIPARLAA